MSESKASERHTLNIDEISSLDPVAGFLLKDFYKDLTTVSEKRALTDVEQKILDQINDTYTGVKNPEGVVNELLDEVYEILKEGAGSNENDDRLYSVLEKVIFINAREKVFKQFFDEIEEAICSVLQLDYSRRIEGLEINHREVNIFNYAAAALNMIIDKMSTACISTKVVDFITRELGTVMIVVVDKSDKVRYVNSFVEQLIGKSKEEVNDMNLSQIIDVESLVNETGGRVVFRDIDRQFSLLRPVAEVIDATEITEKVFLIS